MLRLFSDPPAFLLSLRSQKVVRDDRSFIPGAVCCMRGKQNKKSLASGVFCGKAFLADAAFYIFISVPVSVNYFYFLNFDKTSFKFGRVNALSTNFVAAAMIAEIK
ncbi:hypothetical protein RGU70_09035 [Herbaspirillum sp. RTI4]|uniref:hypothetical protein n=1 Tax=Herbaspirillum sp. RTI4 TaxID=3048640 RepID=UPI002AB368B2|nr:hypothetical protein [Herbaspirillum sp. RTI4]MDY7578467.1 hypothetical protein [Herbaspirillum sp. RTI4]MEA9981504.1 hypothetical protein [Herbaspirillum sp. RTI4]